MAERLGGGNEKARDKEADLIFCVRTPSTRHARDKENGIRKREGIDKIRER